MRARQPLQHHAAERHAEPGAEQRTAVEDEIRGVALSFGEEIGDQGKDDRRETRLADRDPDRRGEQAAEAVLKGEERGRQRPAGDAEREQKPAPEPVDRKSVVSGKSVSVSVNIGGRRSIKKKTTC